MVDFMIGSCASMLAWPEASRGRAVWALLFCGLAWLLPSPSIALERKDLLFYASLDTSLKADYARGKADPLKPAPCSFAKGVRGQGASELRRTNWEGPENIRGEEGTFSFWLCPLDWHSPDGRNHDFAILNTAQGTVRLYQFYPGNLGMLMQPKSGGTRTCWNWGKLDAGRFTQITFAWRPGQWTLYVDGQRRQQVTDGVLPFGEIRSFQLGSDREKTLFDELLVLGRAVSDEEALALYCRGRPAEANWLVTMPQRTAPIRADGRIEPGEYDRALRLAGWTDEILGIANGDRTQAYLTYDERTLYVACVFPVPEEFRQNPMAYVGSPVRMKARGRDVDLSGDDHFEILIRTAEDAVYRFAVNAGSARCDSRNEDASWDADWSGQSHADQDRWTVELALPLSIFGPTAPSPGQAWQMNLRHRAAQVLEQGSVWAFGQPGDCPCTLRFGGSAPAIELDAPGDPDAGQACARVAVRREPAGQPSSWTCRATIVRAALSSDSREKLAPPKLQLVPEEPLERPIRLAPGEKVAAELSRPLERALAGRFEVSLFDAQGQVLLRHQIPLAFSPSTGLEVVMLPSRAQAILRLDAGSAALVAKGVSAEVEVRDGDGRSVARQRLERMASAQQELPVEIRAWPAGRYAVTVRWRVGSIELPPSEKSFEVQPAPEWQDRHVGALSPGEVLAPWTPLEYEPQAIGCWGRRYRYAESVFPAQIEVLGENLLAGPMLLSANQAGKVFAAVGQGPQFSHRGPDRADYTVTGSVGTLDLVVENRLEFDGFLWFKLRVSPRSPGTEVDELALEIPYRPEIATHWYNGQYSPGSDSGYAPRKAYRCAPANMARFGTAERGLQWCWEHRYGWQLAKAEEALELLPAPDAYRVRLKFVDHRVKLDKPLELEMGLQALPCRPLPRGYHGPYWGAQPRVKKTVAEMPMVCLWTRAWPLWNVPKMTPERSQKARERMLADWTRLRMIRCTYSNHMTISPMSPEYRYWQEEWRPVPSPRPDFKALDAMDPAKASQDYSAQVCYGSTSYLDFYCYYLDQSLRAFRGRDPAIPVGLYYDTSGPVQCANPYHDHGIEVDGQRKGVFAILAWREASKRLRKTLKDVDPEGWLTVHMSGHPLAACWGFYDVMIPGEQYAAYFQMKKAQADAQGIPWPYDYTQMLTLDRVRAEYSSQGFGPAQVFLSETWNFARNQPQQERDRGERHLLGMLLVNDVACWGNDSAKLPVTEALWRHLGWDDEVIFVPYWRSQSYLHTRPYDENQIVASLFVRQGRAALCAFNDTDQAQTFRFDLDLKTLGVTGYAGAKLWAPVEQESFPLEGTRTSVPVPPRDFRLLFLVPAGK